jgi:hypothetical protein
MVVSMIGLVLVLRCFSDSPGSKAISMKTVPAKLIWEKTFGGNGDDRVFDLIPVGDGGFLMVSSSTSFVQNRTVGWIVRTDSEGNMLWNKMYNAPNSCELRQAVETNNGFLLVGNTLPPSGEWNGWILKTNKSGDVTWNTTLGKNGTHRVLSAGLANDGYVLVGYTQLSEDSNLNAWIIKIDFEGHILWDKNYGALGDDVFRGVLRSENGELVIAGYTNSYGRGNNDFWLLKTNQCGDVLWNKTFGGEGDDLAFAIAGSKDGYVLAGETHSYQGGDGDAFVVETDLEGNLIWENAYGGRLFDSAQTITSSEDGGCIVAGTTFSYGAGQRDLWVFRLDENGNALWSLTKGTPAFEEAYGICETTGNEIVVAGWKGGSQGPPYDCHLVKINATQVSSISLVHNISFLTVLGMPRQSISICSGRIEE